jgi:oxalate decarboxylase
VPISEVDGLHPSANEGNATFQVKGEDDNVRHRSAARTFDYRAGEVGFVPMSMSHFIENIGNVLHFLELFKSPRFSRSADKCRPAGRQLA